MSLCVTCTQTQPRPVLSNATTTVVAVITAMTFSASGAAPDAALSSVPGELRAHAVRDHRHLRRLRVEPAGGAAHGRLAVGLHRTAARHSRGVGPEHGVHGDVHDGGLGSRLGRRPRAARLCHRACDRFARRRDPRQRSQPRPDPQQHHGILRPDRRQPRRRDSGHLRARSAPAGLCPAAGAVRARGLHSLVHAGNRASARRRHRVAAAARQCPRAGQPRDGAGHAGDHRDPGRSAASTSR